MLSLKQLIYAVYLIAAGMTLLAANLSAGL